MTKKIAGGVGGGGGGWRQTTAKNVWPSSPFLVARERVKIINMILEMAVLTGMCLNDRKEVNMTETV